MKLYFYRTKDFFTAVCSHAPSHPQERLHARQGVRFKITHEGKTMLEARREAIVGALNSERRRQPASPARAVCVRLAALPHRRRCGGAPAGGCTPGPGRVPAGQAAAEPAGRRPLTPRPPPRNPPQPQPHTACPPGAPLVPLPPRTEPAGAVAMVASSLPARGRGVADR